MTRSWLLTSTTYGSWLPGEVRGFVSNVIDGPGPRVRHNVSGTEYDRDMPELRASAESLLKCPPIYLNAEQAQAALHQFRETAAYRQWRLHAVAVMANHFHIVVSAPGDVHSTKLLGDFKSYASRSLNQKWSKPASGTWWTESGSRRPLPDERALLAAIAYVRNQVGALATWIEGQDEDPERGALAP